MTTTAPTIELSKSLCELIKARSELRAVSAMHADDWLHPLELRELARLRDADRREAWRAGRWVGKQLVRQALGHAVWRLADIAIASRNERGELVRPTVIVDGEALPWSLSISHTDCLVAAVLSTQAEETLGIDITARQVLSASFIETWFTPRERAWVNEVGADAASIVWAAKEAAYKAFNDGERFAPRAWEIVPDAAGELSVSCLSREFEINCKINSRVRGENIIVIARGHR